ncbi:MAG: DUF4330 domain-containing protein [Clostridia bacterium]|nr:DUF4330 domain-containing protein [Clostridia bacterium]
MKKTNTRRIGALGWTLILAAVLLVFGAAWRLNILSYFVPKAAPELSEYRVSFRVADISATSADYFADGTSFSIVGSGEPFGTVSGSVAVTPAEHYVEMPDGTCSLVYDSGDRIDVTGTFLVKACVSEDKGLVMLNGTKYLAPNQSITLYSDVYEVTILVTAVQE